MIHKIVPSRNGRTPTFLSISSERLMPIRNSVTVKPAFARFTRASKTLGWMMTGANVRIAAAATNRKMNQGIAIFAFASFSRNATANAIASGAIHNARASFTVAAIASAAAPYADEAPTTELVS